MHADGWFPMEGVGLFRLVVVIAWLIVVARIFGAYTRGPGPPVSSEETLRKRYARGEISKEAFERMLEDLRRSSSSSRGV